jgi:HEPN domain-containing protein
MKSRAGDWLKQAGADLAWAQSSYESGHWAQVCFICQQVGEKALKAIALARGASQVRSHSIVEIAAALGLDEELTRMGKRLDLYYITTRYPDSFASGAPYEYFEEDQALEAVEFADKFVQRARKETGIGA